ncbi:solute carrier family 15 member 2-like [Chironomus tepperi]|uniref:solute carrier family 15 member 2-like n=1 Tax=Chironomus tepperi TaxID=113505 RepID=UPI00391F685C
MFGKKSKSEEKKYLIEQTAGLSKDRCKNYGGTLTGDNELELEDEAGFSLFPSAVIFVLLSKTFEATAANGIRSVLSLYLRDSLLFNEGFATIVLHTFNFFSQSLPICGAILADSYWGNAKTVFVFNIPYVIGYLGMFLATLPYLFSYHSIVYTSLLLIATGNGFLRACITALGAHQFKLPEQKVSLDCYFSAYYFFYYTGILIGKIVPPYVRTKVLVTTYCIEEGQCYTAVFGVIAFSFLVSWIIFLCGLSSYKPEYPTRGNTMINTFNCISYATFKNVCGKSEKQEHWLDRSTDKYTQEFIDDVKTFLKIVKLFLPLPIFYALLAQQDSTWTFQAALTNTNILGIEIQADQFKAIGPILLLMLIPLWQKGIEPMLNYCGIHLSSLECVFIGGLFAVLSFTSAGFLQYYIHLHDINSISVLWQFPQFLFIMIAEMLISVPGLKFAYTHAPGNMKSVLTAIFFINNALGNLIVVGVTELDMFGNKCMEFFFYAFLMMLAAIAIRLLSRKYEMTDSQVEMNLMDEKVIETYVYVDEVTTANMEENVYRTSDVEC